MKYYHLQHHGWTLEYYAKQNKSDKKNQEPYDFTHMWNIKLKAKNEQTREINKKNSQTHNNMVFTRGRKIGD